MSKQKILYINTFAWGSAHEMYNASMLYMCAKLSSQLICRTSKSNYQAMCNLLADDFPDNIDFKQTPSIGGNGRYALLTRYILGAVLDFIYILFSVKRVIIVMPFNNLFALKTINWLNKFLHRQILICCHGEMESIGSTLNRKGLLSQILYNRCNSFFLKPKLSVSNGLYFLVLGDSIKKNLERHIDSSKMGHFVSLDHPYIFTSSPPLSSNETTLSVGTAGAMSESKGLASLMEFATICKEQKIDITISHTGRIIGSIPDCLPSMVDIPQVKGDLSRIHYDNRLAKLDYMLFFYNADHYKITASGAIMDALALNKPIIAIRNDYFEYLFQKFGRFGYLVDDVAQMVEVIKQLLSGSHREDFDFELIKSKFTPQTILNEFRVVIEKTIK